MKKVRNVVLLSSFLATIISLSSCDFTIFDEEKHFEKEKTVHRYPFGGQLTGKC